MKVSAIKIINTLFENFTTIIINVIVVYTFTAITVTTTTDFRTKTTIYATLIVIIPIMNVFIRII